DPLKRQYNANAAVDVLANVNEFALTFDKRSVKSPTTYTEGPEQQIYSSGKGLLGGGTTVDASDFVGESFPTPNWSADVVLWRINLSLALLSGTSAVTTSNAGTSWSGSTVRAVAMTVWAAGSTADPDTSQYFLTDVRVLIRSGADPAARVDCTCRIPNEPQVA